MTCTLPLNAALDPLGVDAPHHGFGDAERDVVAFAVRPTQLAKLDHSRLITEQAPHGGHVELPQVRYFLGSVVRLEWIWTCPDF